MELNLRSALEQNGAKLNDEQVRFVTSMEVALRGAFEANNGTVAKTIEDKLAELNNSSANDELREQLRGLAEKMDKVEKNIVQTGLDDAQKRALRTYVKDNHQTIVDAIRTRTPLGKEGVGLFQIRAAAPHYNSNGTVSLGSGVVVPTVENYEDGESLALIQYPENFILNVIRNNKVAKVLNTRFVTEQAPTEGDASVVLEAGEKPLVQYKFVKNAVSRKKYAGHIEWSEEFETDNEKLFNAILQLFEDTVIRKWNNGLVADIIANAVPYTTSPQSNTIIAPNAFDVASVLQGLIGANNYEADTVIINPATMVSLSLLKTTDGAYISNPLFKDGKLNGMNIVASNSMTSGEILVLDSKIYREEHSGFIGRIGTINDQLITNEVTMVGEVFSLLTVAKIALTASRKGTIATIIADLDVA